MRLDHEFTVPAPIGEVWQAVVDPERVAPCMPGATLTKVEGDKFSGTVKVKLGPISLLYKGNGEFLEKDEAAHKVTIKASGKDSRGSGTAAATVTLTLTEADGGTHGSVATDLAITGKPAQFGRGLISEVGGKILDTFAGCLSGKLAPEQQVSEQQVSEKPVSEKRVAAKPVPDPAAPTTEPTATAEPVAKPEPAVKAPTTAEINTEPKAKPAADRPALHSVPAPPETEAIDLLDYAGQSVLKRVAPVLIGIAALVGLVAIVRALRK
ncbi:carbon monoxide dehydrogenase [Amycolatopsis balhimycina DSM 5908]|uniref:Carbon monoxide dehydrogenase n=1 Tax=Amycolatopsis balhimycina DSM 5908 TaxID=1081091 RepID=A0A428WLN8_AMYBA|nr:SRPBCC family protein [Amycolatopsis balhimycina]RSM43997.1 carbon monoxide dehydrogenase [Amycolatopsis balhimycina DSM 5908]